MKFRLRALLSCLILLPLILSLCTPPQKKSTSWDRYQYVQFKEVLNSNKGYLQFDQKNTIRIYTPANALRGSFTYTGEYKKTSESELMILQAKYSGSMTKEQIQNLFINNVKLSSGTESAWFCVQEPIYQDLLTLDSTKLIDVLYQLAGSTNVDGEERYVFAVMAWVE